MVQVNPNPAASHRFDVTALRGTVTPAVFFKQGASSLTSSKATSCMTLWSILLAPFKFIGGIFASIGKFILDYIFCCCKCGSNSNKIDYEQTKNLLDQIVGCLSGSKDNNEKEKTYGTLLNKLSAEALDEFKHELGLFLADQDYADKNFLADKLNGADRTKYYEDNKDNLKIDDVLQDYQNRNLLAAFKAYLQIVVAKLQK